MRRKKRLAKIALFNFFIAHLILLQKGGEITRKYYLNVAAIRKRGEEIKHAIPAC